MNNKYNSLAIVSLVFLLNGYTTNSIATPVEPGHCHFDGEIYHCGVGGGSTDDDETSFDPLGNGDRDENGEIDPDDEIYGPKEATPEEKETAKQECLSKASVIGTQCDASYATLHSICKTSSYLLGGAIVKAFNQSLYTVGWSEVGAGAATAGYLESACVYVDVKAKAWCKNNTERLEKSCG
jgi:hypothetical protein